MATYTPESLVDMIRQSPPIDVSAPYDAAWIRGKTILVTGGASGVGAGFVGAWAKQGANVIVGDINTEKGSAFVAQLCKETGSSNVHFVHCDVTDWQSQVNLFKEAARLSPHGGIDTVVANAGIAGRDILQMPRDMSVAAPKEPQFNILDVNYKGVMFTTHLAYYWLPNNPGSTDCNKDSDPAAKVRDRHLLLVGSLASIVPIPIQPQYGAAKHAVLGLFRSLRTSSHLHGVRVNLICPYFIDTPIVTPGARFVLAGCAMGKVEDVVDAGSRFVADSRILGRALVVGPKVAVKQNEQGTWELVEKGTPGSEQRALWEPYADDWEDVDAFSRNFVKILNGVQLARGWAGWAKDMFQLVKQSIGLGR